MNSTALVAEPQFLKSFVVEEKSRTKQLYGWLEEQGFLWMLEQPHDQRLAIHTGKAPAVRMWYWSQLAHLGKTLPIAPREEMAVELAFSQAEEIIRTCFT